MALHQNRKRKADTVVSDHGLPSNVSECTNEVTPTSEVPTTKRAKYTVEGDEIPNSNEKTQYDTQAEIPSETGKVDPKSQIHKPKPESLEGMPTEILSQIFVHVMPLDLLHLCWTSKVFRSILASRTSRFIWEASRSQVPVSGLRECPDDLSEAQYANLIFGRQCYFCLEESRENHPKKITTSFYGRFRCCYDCLQDKTLFGGTVDGRAKWMNGPYSRAMLQYLPNVTEVYFESSNSAHKFWCLPIHELWSKEYEAAEDKAKWTRDKIEARTSARKHGRRCESFHVKWRNYLEKQKKNIFKEHFKSLGWAEEISKMTRQTWATHEYNLEQMPWFDFDTITQATLEISIDWFNNRMKSIEEERLALERRLRVYAAKWILDGLLERFALDLPPNSLVPGVGDIILYPAIQDIIHSKEDHEELWYTDFEHLRATFPKLVLQTQREREAKLIAMIAAECGEDSFDPATVLQLATTVFHCEECDSDQGLMQYPRVLVHGHAYYTKPWGEEKDGDHIDEAALREEGRTRWNGTNNISFRKADMLLVSNTLTQLGYDLKTTTRAQMDAQDPILACTRCSDSNHKHVIRWPWMPQHNCVEHDNAISQPPIILERIDEESAQIARIGMITPPDKEPWPGYIYNKYTFLICAHCTRCRPSCDRDSLFNHLRISHNIDNPTDKDIVFKLDADVPQSYILALTTRNNTPRGEGAPSATPQ